MSDAPVQLTAAYAPKLSLGSGVLSLSLGYDHTCVLLTGGIVTCWGDNGYGGLGLGDLNNRQSASTSGPALLGAGAKTTANTHVPTTFAVPSHE